MIGMKNRENRGEAKQHCEVPTILDHLLSLSAGVIKESIIFCLCTASINNPKT